MYLRDDQILYYIPSNNFVILCISIDKTLKIEIRKKKLYPILKIL